VVGSAALRGILRHPRLELAAVKVYSEAKEGRDAGDLIGAAKTGVVATRDADAMLALDAAAYSTARSPGTRARSVGCWSPASTS
jgi:hypothetical protein